MASVENDLSLTHKYFDKAKVFKRLSSHLSFEDQGQKGLMKYYHVFKKVSVRHICDAADNLQARKADML